MGHGFILSELDSNFVIVLYWAVGGRWCGLLSKWLVKDRLHTRILVEHLFDRREECLTDVALTERPATEYCASPRALYVPQSITTILVDRRFIGLRVLPEHFGQVDRLEISGEFKKRAYHAEQHSENDFDQ